MSNVFFFNEEKKPEGELMSAFEFSCFLFFNFNFEVVGGSCYSVVVFLIVCINTRRV